MKKVMIGAAVIAAALVLPRTEIGEHALTLDAHEQRRGSSP
ncbi:hypothetical protein [Candidatus Mycolicibacterium alkanivorans]|nr:hypothetical protein [Candidatus Mycolicibacterium alkanivorans]